MYIHSQAKMSSSIHMLTCAKPIQQVIVIALHNMPLLGESGACPQENFEKANVFAFY